MRGHAHDQDAEQIDRCRAGNHCAGDNGKDRQIWAARLRWIALAVLGRRRRRFLSPRYCSIDTWWRSSAALNAGGHRRCWNRDVVLPNKRVRRAPQSREQCRSPRRPTHRIPTALGEFAPERLQESLSRHKAAAALRPPLTWQRVRTGKMRPRAAAPARAEIVAAWREGRAKRGATASPGVGSGAHHALRPAPHAHHERVVAVFGNLHPQVGIAAEGHHAVVKLLEHWISPR
jgi:hypothetical protein